jgi:hypothetical protein
MKALFIGGCADGRWLTVPDGARRFQTSVTVGAVPGGPGRRPLHILSVDEYAAMNLGTDSRQAVVFVWTRITPADAIEMLLTGYRRANAPVPTRKPL